MRPWETAVGLLLACVAAEPELRAELLSVRGATPSTTGSIIQLVARSDGLARVSRETVPTAGTFWVMTANGAAAPMSCLHFCEPGVAVYAITGKMLPAAAGDRQVNLQSSAAARTAEALEILCDKAENVTTQMQTASANRQTQAMAISMMAASDSGGRFAPTFDFPTNLLYLQITGVVDGAACLILNNATGQVYEVMSKTDLTATNWAIEPGALFPTNSSAMPFMVLVLDRTNSLFIRARDWTGVTSGSNQTPDWWFWNYFQTLDLSDNNIDANGNMLLYDYTNGIAPNAVGRPLLLLSTIHVADPVDVKWAGNLYVLSGSTATLTEFDTNGSTVRSLNGLGSNPSGFDVDATGNVYVALTGGNQVWKFNPMASSFAADTNFGFGGYIGATNGASGNDTNEFNAPFDVAVSPDSGTLSVSDSGNDRIQQFSTNGTFIAAFGSPGSEVGQFNMPRGLTYDSIGNLYIADSGNHRIVLAQGSAVLGASGTGGTGFGQFNAPANASVNDRGIYVADAGNNRIQCFNPFANEAYSFTTTDVRFVLSTNLNQPATVAAVNNLTNEIFYVADTGHNRVLLYGFPGDDPTPAWNILTDRIAAGDISGAISQFAGVSTNQYLRAIASIGTNNIISAIGEIGELTPVYINNQQAEYYFTNTIDGQIITFPVEFVKENGVWKILEF